MTTILECELALAKHPLKALVAALHERQDKRETMNPRDEWVYNLLSQEIDIIKRVMQAKIMEGRRERA